MGIIASKEHEKRQKKHESHRIWSCNKTVKMVAKD